MIDPDAAPVDFAETVAIAGVGLIGGSIALALKQRGFAGTVLGVGRNPDRLNQAQSLGLIDDFTLNISETQADLWVVCTPVDRIVSDVLSIQKTTNGPTLITDAGSVKQEICDRLQNQLPQGLEFLGSHPLAGSEQRGFEHAEGNLFENRVCVLTPNDSTSKIEWHRLRRFWEFLGMQVVEMSAAEHDLALAETSHLPHFLASALAATLEEENAHLAATGFADTTRIAAGDPELWSAIFLQNAEPLLTALAKFAGQLHTFEEAVRNRDVKALQSLLKLAKTKRDNLP